MDRIYYGTDLKYIVEIESAGFSMLDHDFDILLKRGTGVRKFFAKTDLVYDGENFYVCFNTSDFGKGVITAVVTAHVPDDDFEDGIRDEVEKFDLVEVLSV